MTRITNSRFPSRGAHDSLSASDRIVHYGWRETDAGCWEFAGPRDVRGYGALGVAGARLLAHRVMFEQHNGQLLPGDLVRHKCDNPPCVNPDHLEAGSHGDNAADKMRRGRFRPMTGASNGNARLNVEKVRDIRARAGHQSRQAIADLFNISKATVTQIVNRRTWKEVL